MTIHQYAHINRFVRTELQELHRETLPADTLPSFRGLCAAVARLAEGDAVAYVTWRRNKASAVLDRIGVLEEWREEGLAGELLDVALKHCRPLPVKTYIAAYNVPSQRLFISRGFLPFETFEDHGNTFIRFAKGTK